MSGGAAGAGSSRVVAKMEASIAGGDFYGALQMAKSLFARKKSVKKMTEAVALLEEAAMTMANHKQASAASDLAVQLCQTYTEEKLAVNRHRRSIIERVCGSMSPCVDQSNVLQEAVKWAVAVTPDGAQDMTFNAMAASSFWGQGDGAASSRYFLHAGQPRQYADMLLEWSTAGGYQSERDLFLGRAVLQLLAHGNLKGANALRDRFLARLPAAEKRQAPSPLMNFLRFLLLTLERDAAPLFKVLVDKYKPSLERDPTLLMHVARIGTVFYKIQPPKSMIEQMMGMLGGAGME